MVKSSAYSFAGIFVNNYLFLSMNSNVTIKNVSWPHFSWATLYNIFEHVVRSRGYSTFKNVMKLRCYLGVEIAKRRHDICGNCFICSNVDKFLIVP